MASFRSSHDGLDLFAVQTTSTPTPSELESGQLTPAVPVNSEVNPGSQSISSPPNAPARRDSTASDAQTLVEKNDFASNERCPESMVEDNRAVQQWRRKRFFLIGMAASVLIGTAIAIGVMIHSSDKDRKVRSQ